MSTRKVECGSCGQSWVLTGANSVYEQQSVESRPCPRCGAYTLRCPETRPTPHPSRIIRFLSRSVRMAG